MSGKVNLTKEQNEVINVRHRDVLVAASAGSGKTFVVAHRIINRVINDNVDIDKILVVTFTNAAASELKSRILSGFYDELKNKDLSKEKRSHLQRQLSLINRAQISTIHSFCLSVIKNNFYILSLDPNIKTLDESKAKIMLLESIDEVVEEEYENKTEIFLKILELFKNEENVVQNIEKIYNFSMSMPYPEKWLNEALEKYELSEEVKDLSETSFGTKIIQSIKEKLQLLNSELEKVCDKIRFDKDFESRLDILENMMEKISNIQIFSKYDDIFEYVHNKLDFPRLPSSKCVNEELKKEVADIKKKVTNELKNISKMVYKDTKGIFLELFQMYDIVSWFVTIVNKVTNLYTNKKIKTGYIDFADYEHLALKVLENEEIREEYKKKFDEIYIDEYQDTSYVQEIILKSISKNNRIMVGDVKQSIYSFRNAEPGLFNKKYHEYEIYNDNLEADIPSKIILSKNFRSREIVLNSINDVFKKIMSEDVGQCDYTKNEYLMYGDGYSNETENLCMTEVNIVETENQLEEYDENDLIESQLEDISNVQKEAYMIAEKIQELITSEFKIYDSKKKEYRNIEYKDIVILLRSVTNKANIYEEVLKANNIPAFSDTSDSFYNGQEVSIILSFLKIIDNIYDDVALVSTMYSIIGGFTLDDLVYIRSFDKRGYFYDAMCKAYEAEKENSTEMYLKIHKFINLIKEITRYLSTFTIAETILKIYEDTGIYYAFYLEEMGKQKCANLDSLVEIARTFEKEERSSIYEFLQYIENIKGRKTKGNDTPKLLGEGENVVRILTIHKSKGLEYPVVFLADSSKKYNTLDITSEILLDKNYGIGLDTYNTDIGISYSNIIKQAIKERIKDNTLSEEERLLYVAMTRAKEKLYIYGTVKNYAKFIDKLFVQSSEKLSPVIVKYCNSYLKLVMLALNSGNSPNFKINVMTAKDSIEKIINSSIENIDRNMSCKDKFLKRCKETNIKKGELDSSFSQKYKYMDNIDVKKKYTVTEIKNMNKDNEEDVSNLIIKVDYTALEDIKPKCIQENVSNMNYGSIIHKILENIDYKNINLGEIENSIESICENQKGISQNSIKHIINNYLNSDVACIAKEAKSISKELPFVIFDDLNEIEELRLKEKTYIQGVIDLYIVTKDDKNIIVDFKTDIAKSEKELMDKYKYQLLVYKKGIELSKDVAVDNLYIYSFYLNKLIKVM